jgi:hypothetical protein
LSIGVIKLGTIGLKEAMIEVQSSRSEKLSREKVVYLGRLAIRLEYLGINDPLAYLYQYLENSELSTEDIETDIVERLPEATFVNRVDFNFTGDDFVSFKDRVSMDLMTRTNLQILKERSNTDPVALQEYQRAKTESEEVTKLTNWFPDAPTGDYLIFESLPIGEQQKFAVSRIYQKTSINTLEGCFVSLYGSSIDQFNEFHKSLGVDTPAGNNAADILKNNYEFYNPDLTKSSKFIDYYVDTYDQLLGSKNDKTYHFGQETDKDNEKQNDLTKVRSSPQLTAIYIETVKTIAESNGVVTSELLELTRDKTKIGYPLELGQIISTDTARGILKETMNSIVSTFNHADAKTINTIQNSSSESGSSYDAVSQYGAQARNAGETYNSNGCPEFVSNNLMSPDNANSELNKIEDAFNISNNLPENFGKAKIGVCRIPNCPSRGEQPWWWIWGPDKTLVGGCDICVCCHKHLGNGHSPSEIYARKQKIKNNSHK